jgi:putative transposase
LTTIARLAGPGGARALVAESLLVKHQLPILNRSRHRSPNLRPADRLVAGLCALLMPPGRLIRAAIVLQPFTLVRFASRAGPPEYRRLFSSTRKTPGTKGPHPDVIAAVVAMKQRNPTWGCPRIAQQIAVAFGIALDKDVVRRILGRAVSTEPGLGGPVVAHDPRAREGPPLES